MDFTCREVQWRQMTASQEVEAPAFSALACLLHCTAPLKVLCSKFGPTFLLWCSLWVRPDVYRFFTDKQLSGSMPNWLRAVSSDGKSLSFSTLFYHITHTVVFAESQSPEGQFVWVPLWGLMMPPTHVELVGYQAILLDLEDRSCKMQNCCKLCH